MSSQFSDITFEQIHRLISLYAQPSSWNESESEVSVPSSNPILDAAALQDRLTRQYSLHLHFPGTKSKVQGSRKKGQGMKFKSRPSSKLIFPQVLQIIIIVAITRRFHNIDTSLFKCRHVYTLHMLLDYYL